MTKFASGIRPFVWSATAALLSAHPGIAQSPTCTEAPDSSAATVQWAAPLDRFVTAHAAKIPLRDALSRVVAITKIRLSYSTESVPLDRSVCLSADRTPAGRVLSDLLAGTNVSAVAVGSDQVVLAPRAAVPERQAAPEMASSMSVLDKMVVTGSKVGAPAREATVSADVLTGHQLSRDNTNTISGVLDGYVPGVWSWTQSPTSVASSFASIRGASSFGLSYPKIYVDGIEVANPLLITRFATDAIERVEVIRGPQGSALYGTDAISGVVNIVTRHEGTGADGQHAMLRTSAGLVESDFARGVVAQNHALSLVTGSPTSSADLHISGGTVGDFIPNGFSRDLVATGGARVIRDGSTFSATARFFTQQTGSGTSPLLSRPLVDTSNHTFAPSTAPQSIQEYTLGTSATFAPNDRWTHSIVAGVDGYSLANVQTSLGPVTTVADSALRAAQGGAERGTIRASSVLRLGDGDATKATLTFSAEQGLLHATSTTYETTPASPEHGAPQRLQPTEAVYWQNNTGLTTQAAASLDNTWFASGGIRLERDSRLPGSQVAALPMLGLAAVHDVGAFSVKLRGAYGEGIRPAATFGRSTLQQNMYSSTQPSVGAEKQSGTEAGFDLAFRQSMSLRVTRFDQRASGLIQQVAILDSNPLSRRMRNELENVGEISNRGWEMEAAASVARLTVTGTLSFVDSRVEKLATGYNGDLMTGDRMLQVPARTGALNLTYTGRRWLATLGGSRALDWINYDELGLSQAYLSDTRPLHDLVGQQLRNYWRRYNGGLRIRASASHDFRDMFTFEVSGDNLLNYQTNEPDNLTIVPGRTIMTGVKLKF